MSDPFKALGLPHTATKAEVTSRFHQLALEMHPDTGGVDADAFQQLQEAYQEARKLAPDYPICPRCVGKGLIKIQHGFYSMHQMCDNCNGLGHL